MNFSGPGSVLPAPKKYDEKGGRLVIGKDGQCCCHILLRAGASILEVESAGILARKIDEALGDRPGISEVRKKSSGLATVEFKIENLGGCEERYTIDIGNDGVVIEAAHEKGVFYGVQTLIQLFELKDNVLVLPKARIEDYPDMKHRGLFIEDRYGTDRMTLQDWKDVVDYMAALKMNLLGVGVYGCWCIQYNNSISEFWYLPISKYPQLKTEQLIRYYSASENAWKTSRFLPAMYEEDFFGELIAYGKTRNVIVRPHFNSMGHNTLIPRLIPETSAKDAGGRPVGYSFCTSNPRTYEVLFDIYDEIIDKYLVPNGIDWFHMGLDEVWSQIGTDPGDYFKEHDPWCKCEECSKHTHEELFVEHLIKLAKHLKAKGMKNITAWHDQLLKMDLINERLVERLKAEGLYDVLILSWWRYGVNPLETLKPETGIRRFVTPMTGYYHWMATDSYLVNIYRMLELGSRDGAEGAESYCVYDLSYDRNCCCLSEYSWNNSSMCSLDEFKNRYIDKCFSSAKVEAAEAMRLFDSFAELGEKRNFIVTVLTYYIYTYVRAGKDYPRNFPGEIFMVISSDPLKYKSLLKEVCEESSRAYELFSAMQGSAHIDMKLVEHYKVECLNYKVLSNEFLKLTELGEGLKQLEGQGKGSGELKVYLEKFIGELEQLIKDRRRLIMDTELVKAHYHVPSELRNMSIHMQYLVDLSIYLCSVCRDIESGNTPQSPILDLTDTRALESSLSKRMRMG